MAIVYDIIHEGSFLRVISQGAIDNLGDIAGYAADVHQAATRSTCRKLLIDETQLKNQLSISDLYNAAEMISLADYPIVKAAFCGSQACEQFIQFWENAMVNRGRYVRCFGSIAEAEAWLG